MDFDGTDAMLRIALADGREQAAPLEWFPWLRDASAEQRQNWQVIEVRQGDHWLEAQAVLEKMP